MTHKTQTNKDLAKAFAEALLETALSDARFRQQQASAEAHDHSITMD